MSTHRHILPAKQMIDALTGRELPVQRSLGEYQILKSQGRFLNMIDFRCIRITVDIRG